MLTLWLNIKKKDCHLLSGIKFIQRETHIPKWSLKVSTHYFSWLYLLASEALWLFEHARCAVRKWKQGCRATTASLRHVGKLSQDGFQSAEAPLSCCIWGSHETGSHYCCCQSIVTVHILKILADKKHIQQLHLQVNKLSDLKRVQKI